MFRKGHSYNVAGARTETRGQRVGSGPEITGTFKRNDSVALRGGVRAAKRILENDERRSNVNSAPNSRRGSDGSLTKSVLSVFNEIQSRRSSSPNISLDVGKFRLENQNDSRLENQYKRQSSYLELLEEVVSELNLEGLTNGDDSSCNPLTHDNHNKKDEDLVQIAFQFLDDFESDNSQVLKIIPIILIYNLFNQNIFVEASGPRHPQQDVHKDRLPILAGEESPGHNLAEMLLSIYKRK